MEGNVDKWLLRLLLSSLLILSILFILYSVLGLAERVR